MRFRGVGKLELSEQFLQELVAGQYEADLYTVHGLTLESRKRREHLSADDLEKNKAMLSHFTKGTYNNGYSEVTIGLVALGSLNNQLCVVEREEVESDASSG